jgi:metal-sulfur cluster biosynthetic enzyme
VVGEIQAALGAATQVHVEVCWEPPWGPERMSPRARRVLEA